MPELWRLQAALRTPHGQDATLSIWLRVTPPNRADSAAPLAACWALSAADGSFHAGALMNEPARAALLDEAAAGTLPLAAPFCGALLESLRRGRLPRPDRLATRSALAPDRLLLEDASATLELRLGAAPTLFLRDERAGIHCDLAAPELRFQDPAPGWHLARAAAVGRLGVGEPETTAGTLSLQRITDADPAPGAGRVAVQLVLDDGLYVTIEERGGAPCAVVSDPAHPAAPLAVLGGPVRLTPLQAWGSTRTYNRYATAWRLALPDAALDLSLQAVRDDQEVVTLLRGTGAYEGRFQVRGTRAGRPVRGSAFVSQEVPPAIADSDDFVRSVGDEVRRSVRDLVPQTPSFEALRALATQPTRPRLLDGVDPGRVSPALLAPIHDIALREGKGWRSYFMLAVCDAVGGDSTKLRDALGAVELLQVGSLIVDDVEDGSEVRRGGPASHVVHGVPLALNAGSLCYFLSERVIQRLADTPELRLKLHDVYLDALIGAHVGQGLDLYGLSPDDLAQAAETGDTAALEGQLLSMYRLKTAVPIVALARMGALLGGGSEAQSEALEGFSEALGLAFQLVDDVLNVRGFGDDRKCRGEDLAQGKVTYPVLKALRALPPEDRAGLLRALDARSADLDAVLALAGQLERCGAVGRCLQETQEDVEAAWQRLDPFLDESIHKIMLRASCSLVIERTR